MDKHDDETVTTFQGRLRQKTKTNFFLTCHLMSGGFLRMESSLLFERVFALYSTIVLSLYRWRKIDFKMTII